MNITNMEIAQATMEIFGGFACLLSAFIIILNRHKKPSMVIFKRLFLGTAVLFFSESLVFVFCGNQDLLSRQVTGISQTIVLICNLVLGNLLASYAFYVVKEKGGKPEKRIMAIPGITGVIGLVMLVMNYFNDFIYYFDEENNLVLAGGWKFYMLMPLIGVLTGVYIAIRFKAYISHATRYSILFYLMVPFFTIIMQTFTEGFSVTNMGIAVTLFIMFVAYLKEWNSSKEDSVNVEKKKRVYQVVVLFIIMVFTMSASLLSCIISINRISLENSKNDSLVVANMIGSDIDKIFMEPIIVVETMSRDSYIQSTMDVSNESKESAEAIGSSIATRLSSIRQGFGYEMIYVQSEYTSAMYTDEGFIAFTELDNDGKWYKELVDSGKRYYLKVDTDSNAKWDYSIFINMIIENSKDQRVGACGIGIDFYEFEKFLAQYEEKYNVDICIADANGFVQINSDGIIDTAKYVDNNYFDKVGSDVFYYERVSSTCRMTRRLNDMDWYIVVVDNNAQKINVLEVILPSGIIFLIGIILMGLVFAVMSIREQKIQDALALRQRVSITDELTGLNNRRAYAEEIDAIVEAGNKDDYIIMVMDINALKQVNDNVGHAAGDELIIGAANNIEIAFGKLGKIYRIGGDEFVALLKCSEEKLNIALETFKHINEQWKGELSDEMAISIGAVVCGKSPDLSFTEAIELADRRMYQDKSEYYKAKGIDRRKR